MDLSLVYYDEPILRTVGQKVDSFGPDLERLGQEMLLKMREWKGIGLAAQQVDIDRQICVVEVLGKTEDVGTCICDGRNLPLDLVMPLILVNPEITFPDENTTDVLEEGCLSFPGVNGDVLRPDRVTVRYQDTMGGAHTLEASGLISRCIQHEVDHLNGVLFIDRMKKESLKKIKKALGRMKRH